MSISPLDSSVKLSLLIKTLKLQRNLIENAVTLIDCHQGLYQFLHYSFFHFFCHSSLPFVTLFVLANLIH